MKAEKSFNPVYGLAAVTDVGPAADGYHRGGVIQHEPKV